MSMPVVAQVDRARVLGTKTAQHAMEPRPARRQAATGVAHLSVRSLRRSINFFSLVLDFEVVADRRRGARPHVVMAAHASARVVLWALPADVAAHTPKAARTVIAVADLDGARGRIWNAGLRVARDDTITAAAIRDGARCLSVRDPDGNELELVEAADGAPSPASAKSCPASSAAKLGQRANTAD